MVIADRCISNTGHWSAAGAAAMAAICRQVGKYNQGKRHVADRCPLSSVSLIVADQTVEC